MKTTTIETVTPRKARLWLTKLYRGQRQLRPRKLAELVAHMRAGTFADNGDPIRFDVHGQLIDGQHRLNAIAQSGVTLELVIIRGLETHTYATIDQGAKRTPADLLRFQGVRRPHIKATIAGQLLGVSRSGKGTISTAEWAVSIDKTMDVAVEVSDLFRGRKWMVTQSCIGAAALHLLRDGCDPQDVRRFFKYVATGNRLTTVSPLMHLRDALLTGQCLPGFYIDVNTRRRTRNVIALTSHLWNKWGAGDPVRRVRLSRTSSGYAIPDANPVLGREVFEG